MRILLIEDDPSIQKVVAMLLKANQHEVSAYDSAEDGLEAFEPDQFDCLLMDNRLPGMTGLEAAMQIRKRAETPIILATAGDWGEHQEALKDLADVHSVHKPYDIDELRGILARINA
ncbi:MAG: response regulator [Opitutales bacterium]